MPREGAVFAFPVRIQFSANQIKINVRSLANFPSTICYPIIDLTYVTCSFFGFVLRSADPGDQHCFKSDRLDPILLSRIRPSINGHLYVCGALQDPIDQRLVQAQ